MSAQHAARLSIPALYRRSLRAAEHSIPEMRGGMLTWVRSRFRDGDINKHTSAMADKHAELMREGWEELERFVRVLRVKDRLTEERANWLCSPAILAEPTAATPTPVPTAAASTSAEQQLPLPSAAARELKTWSESAVGEWLRSLGLSDALVAAFATARVDGRFLLELDDDDLLELGMTSRLQRKLVLSRREGLREDD